LSGDAEVINLVLLQRLINCTSRFVSQWMSSNMGIVDCIKTSWGSMIHTALPKQTFPGIIITFVRGSNGDPGNLNYNPYAAQLTVWNPAQLSRGLIRTERQNASDRFCPSPFETDEIWASRTDSAMFLSPLLQMPLSPFCPPPI